LENGSFGSRFNFWYMKNRVITYIDGFNLYHAICEITPACPWLKWLNLWKLSESLLRADQELVEANYFSAYSTWTPDRYKRHRDYTAALQAEGVSLVLGKFKRKYLTCHKCGREYETREEKETDVNIALRIVTDGLLDRYDTAILISADTDLRPALDMARKLNPQKRVVVVAPPHRRSRARDLAPILELTPGRLEGRLLQDSYVDPKGRTIYRPQQYRKHSK
jgi:uncharacterized LabA/DUF88 family protein